MTLVDSNGDANFWIPISNGIFRKPHPEQIDFAIWLLLLLEDWVDSGEGRDGLVRGGQSLTDAEIGKALGRHSKSIAAQRERLAEFGYISITRTPRGYCYRVSRSKKLLWLKGRKNQPPTADAPKDKPAARVKPPEAWSAIGLTTPCGPPNFQRLWEESYAKRGTGPLSKSMGEVLDAWTAIGEAIPAPFARALARIRENEKQVALEKTEGQSVSPIRVISSEEIPV